ncbi:DUF5694 domain-containing protein [Halogeometricum borinquense]|nr:DUF5694 domain-containing protein [Halogeometricum borinquense]
MAPNLMDRRSFVGATAAAAIAGLAGCNAVQDDPKTLDYAAADPWPSTKDGQREVMLLGTSHLAQTPEDTQNAYALDAGNVLGEQRQRELETLTDRLAAWDPDRIAVEHVASEQSIVDRAYTAYTTDNETIDTVSGWDRDRSDEIIQVGFRLADKLGHDSVAAVDYYQRLDALLTEEEKQQLSGSLQSLLIKPDSVQYPISDIGETVEQEQQRLNEGSLLEHYKRLNMLNSESSVWQNDQQLYATAFENSDPGEYTMVKLMTAWTQRNLRIASNIWNVPNADDQRTLVIYGSSHVPQLGQILTGSPMMSPVSPLPYLDG